MRNAADVVRVVMRNDEVVDLFDARELRGRRNAIGVPAVGARETGVDQQ